MDRTQVINAVINALGAKKYLEIGVYVPERNYDLIEAEKKTGVDPSVGDESRGILRVTSNEFFEGLNARQRFDVIFIDGSHIYEQVQRDVENAFKFLGKGGAIIMHDINPENVIKAAPLKPSYGAAWSGECWKVYVEFRAHAIVSGAAIAEDHGTGILVQRESPTFTRPDPLSYPDLEANRQQYLNIIPSNAAAIEAFLANA